MTKITLIHIGGKVRGYRVEGHTGYAPNGEDIVCAAISVLATTCANSLTLVAGLNPDTVQKEALLEVKLRRSNRKALTIFKVFEIGVVELSRQFPDHVKVYAQNTTL